jgi:hypothetical protein
MLERFEVQRREAFVFAMRVGATVLAFDFADYADDRARIVSLRRGAGTCRRLVGHCYWPHPRLNHAANRSGLRKRRKRPTPTVL